MPRSSIPAALRETRLIAIIRATEATHVPAVCDALIDAGVRCLEITTNTPGWTDELRRLRRANGDAIELGAGTVRTAEQADLAADTGATFAVAPDVNPGMGKAARARGLGWYPGALTPTEIATAWRDGATAVKLFPAATVGPDYLRHVRAPLDDVALIPTGGVTLDAVADYLAAGAVAVGMAGPLLGDALRTGDVAPLAERARAVLAATKGTS